MGRKTKRQIGRRKPTMAIALSQGAKSYFEKIASSLSMPTSQTIASFLEQAVTDKLKPTLLWQSRREEIHRKLLKESKASNFPSQGDASASDDNSRVPMIDLGALSSKSLRKNK